MAQKTPSPPVFDKSRNRWKATIPAGLSADGKRVRSWHATRDAAREYIESITRSEAPAATISPSLAMEADKARVILEPWNLDIVQAAREVAAALEVLGDAGSILEAARAYRATHTARHSSKPLGEAVAMYLDSKIDLRDATLKSYRYSLERVFSTLQAQPMADISTAQLEAILSALEILPFEAPADRTYGEVRARLEAAGTPIGGNDMLIAAHAISSGHIVVTDNEREFGRVAGLQVLNWLR